MPQLPDCEMTLPIVIEEIFEEDIANSVNEAAAFFGVEPRQLILYGLGTVLKLMEVSEERGTECSIHIGTDRNDHDLMRIILPKEAALEQII